MGGWGKIDIKDHLSTAEAKTWTELGNRVKKHSLFRVIACTLFLFKKKNHFAKIQSIECIPPSVKVKDNLSWSKEAFTV